MGILLLMLGSLIINVVSLGYLIKYMRNGAVFKRHISTLAYIVILYNVLNICSILGAMPDGIYSMSIAEFFGEILICGFVIRSRGNVSTIISRGTDYGTGSSGA